MLEFVEELLNSKDNMIDQLILLKENKHHPEVKKYMRALLKDEHSPYYQYCINKYYFDQDIPEVTPRIPVLCAWHNTEKRVEKLIESKPTLIEQLQLLSKHKQDKAVNDYIEDVLFRIPRPYIIYCVNKYYYNQDIEEVKPTAKTLRLRLDNILFPRLLKKQQKKKRKAILASRKKVKPGDTIEILEGPFTKMAGTFKSYDKQTLKYIVIFELFGTDIECECDEPFKIIKN